VGNGPVSPPGYTHWGGIIEAEAVNKVKSCTDIYWSRCIRMGLQCPRHWRCHGAEIAQPLQLLCWCFQVR